MWTSIKRIIQRKSYMKHKHNNKQFQNCYKNSSPCSIFSIHLSPIQSGSLSLQNPQSSKEWCLNFTDLILISHFIREDNNAQKLIQGHSFAIHEDCDLNQPLLKFTIILALFTLLQTCYLLQKTCYPQQITFQNISYLTRNQNENYQNNMNVPFFFTYILKCVPGPELA